MWLEKLFWKLPSIDWNGIKFCLHNLIYANLWSSQHQSKQLFLSCHLHLGKLHIFIYNFISFISTIAQKQLQHSCWAWSFTLESLKNSVKPGELDNFSTMFHLWKVKTPQLLSESNFKPVWDKVYKCIHIERGIHSNFHKHHRDSTTPLREADTQPKWKKVSTWAEWFINIYINIYAHPLTWELTQSPGQGHLLS